MPRIQKHLFVVGCVGYDVYLLSSSDVHVKPAGAAYNIASGVHAVNGEALIAASVGRCINRDYFQKFRTGGVKIVTSEVEDGSDNVFVFDLRDGGSRPELNALFSIGKDPSPAGQVLEKYPFQDVHIHIGTMPLQLMQQRLALFSSIKPVASFSCSIYAPYLVQNSELAFSVLDRCLIAFLNFDEFDLLRSRGFLERVLKNRIVIVTCGEFGAIGYVDGVPVFSAAAERRNAVCAIGAGDVFVGAFLSSLLSSRRVSDAMKFGVEVAAISVEDYGVEQISAFRSKIDSCRAKFGEKRIPLLLPEDACSLSLTNRASRTEVVVATGVFVVRDHQLLLIRKPDVKAFDPGMLYVPGGKLESGEKPEDCGRRELKEETSLEGGHWSNLGLFQYCDPNRPERLYLFHQFLVRDPTGLAKAAADATECLWLPLEDLEQQPLFRLARAQVFLGRLLGIF